MAGVVDVSKLYDNALYNKLHLSHIFTKKRDIIKVKQGFVTYDVNIKNIKCVCSSGICCHLMYIFANVFNINLKYMLSFDRNRDVYLDVLNKYISKEIDWDFIGSLLNKHIEDETKDLECVICMIKINNVFTSYQCPLCKKFSHTKCQNKWFATNKTCVHCMQDVRDILPK
jgi:hypothetical protein